MTGFAHLREMLANRRRLGCIHDRQLGVSEHSSEDVIEIMRDPAGQLPQRLELLRLPQLLLDGRAPPPPCADR